VQQGVWFLCVPGYANVYAGGPMKVVAGSQGRKHRWPIVNAYELMGTYRGAAVPCGTTAKTVKRVLERRAVGQVGRRPAVAPATDRIINVRASTRSLCRARLHTYC
jgi:hypothetical protein